MALNIPNVIAFLVVLFLVLGAYYTKVLTVDEGENKRVKMLKRILVFMVIIGFVHIYSLTAQQNQTQIQLLLITFFAVVLNIYSVYRSTKKCGYPKLYVIQLSLFTALITIVVAGILWYSTFNNLFGFMVLQEDSEITEAVRDVFDSKEIDRNLGLYEDSSDCPTPDEPEGTNPDYDAEMNALHTTDLDRFNTCLEREIRADLEDQ